MQGYAGHTGQSNALSTQESAHRAAMESIIERGQETFVEVANALLVIRDEKLWRTDYDSFDAYCAGRWGFEKRRANQLIQAANLIKNIADSAGNHGSQTASGAIDNVVLPTSERQVRPLAALPPAEQREAWKAAVVDAPKDDNGKPKITGKAVKTAVEKVKAKRTPAMPPKDDPLQPPPDDGEDDLELPEPTEDAPWAKDNDARAARIMGLRWEAARLAEWLGCPKKGNAIANKWAQRLSRIHTVGAILQICRTIRNLAPMEASDKPPGYLTYEQVKIRERKGK